MSAEFVTLTAAALVGMGGVMGFVKAGSKASLISGLVFGSLFGFSTLYMRQPPFVGHYIALGTCLLSYLYFCIVMKYFFLFVFEG
jgi:uncharacterized membrane protein (UPF0136 family)